MFRYVPTSHFIAILLLHAILLLPDASAQKKDSVLAIVDAGIQNSEDGPFVSQNFRFLPADFLYATFQIVNFTKKQENSESPATISLQYAATLADARGLPLAAPELGTIQSELSAEDKNWTPKRRLAFTLPPFFTAGKATLSIVVKDLLGGTETTRSLPVLLGGVVVIPSDRVAVQDIQFFRKDSGSDALDVPAFTAGDAIFVKFNMTGFKTDAQNSYRLVYDLLVLRPDGKPYIQQPRAAEISAGGFYPAQFLPGTLQLTTTATSAKGTYPVVLTLHDLIANTTVQVKTTFQLE